MKNKILSIFMVLTLLGLPFVNSTAPDLWKPNKFELKEGEKYNIPNSNFYVVLKDIYFPIPIDGNVGLYPSKYINVDLCYNYNSGNSGSCANYQKITEGKTIEIRNEKGDLLIVTPEYISNVFVDFSYEIAYKTDPIPYNNDPVINGVGGPTEIKVNEKGTWRISAYDPEGNYLYYNVDWGDGPIYFREASANRNTASQETTFTHTYHYPGNYVITFTVSDEQGATAKSSITVNVLPGQIIKTPDLAVTEITLLSDIHPKVGQEVRFGIVLANYGDGIANGYSVSFDYGDGSGIGNFVSETIQPGQTIKHEISHVYKSAGKYTFMVTVDTSNDSNPNNNVLTHTFTIYEAIENQSPTIDGVSGPQNLEVGEQGTWTVKAHDSDSQYLLYSVVWGDETLVPVLPSQSDLNKNRVSQEATFTHAYSNPGVYRVVFAVTDDKGASTQTSLTLNVGDNANNDTKIKLLRELFKQLEIIIHRIGELLQDF